MGNPIKSLTRFFGGLILIGVGILTGNPALAFAGLGLVSSSFDLQQLNIEAMSNPLDGQQSHRILYGQRRLGLQLDDRRVDKSSDKDRDLYIVGAVCLGSRPGAPNDGAIEEIGDVYFDNELAMTAAGVHQAPFFARKGLNTSVPTIFRHERYLGTTVQTVDSALNSKFPSVYNSTTHRNRGVAYMVVGLTFHKSVYNVGVPPTITVDAKGSVVWDPRLGPSSDPANWAWSDNPALCTLDLLLRPRRHGGGGMTEAKIKYIDSFKDAADYCDELVSIPDGAGGTTTEKRFTCNGIVDTGNKPKHNIAQLLTSMGTTADLVPMGDGVRLVIRRDIGSAPFGTIDLAVGSTILDEPDLSFTLPGLAERWNEATARFVDPEQDYQVDEVTWPPSDNNPYLAEDNEYLSPKPIDLPFTTGRYMAQRIAMVAVKESRLANVVASFPASEAALMLQPGDDVSNVTWDTPGWNPKPFWIRGLALSVPTDPEENEAPAQVIVQEYQPNAYSLDPLDDAQTYPDTDHIDGRDIDPPSSLQATSTYREEGDGTIINLITADWIRVLHALLDFTELQAKKSTDSVWNIVGRIEEDEGDEVTGAQEKTFDAHSYGVKGDSVDVRARSVAVGGGKSFWVEAQVEIGGKTAAPDAVTGLTVRIDEGWMYLDWNEVTNVDIKDYEVRRDGTDWDDATVVKPGLHATKVDLSPDIVKAIDSRSILFRVAARNRSGIYGVADTEEFSDPVPDATASTFEVHHGGGSGPVTVKIADIKAYEATRFRVHASTTSGFTPSESTVVSNSFVPFLFHRFFKEIGGTTGPMPWFTNFSLEDVDGGPVVADGTTEVYVVVEAWDDLSDVFEDPHSFSAQVPFTPDVLPSEAVGGATPGPPTNDPTSGTFSSSTDGFLKRHITLGWSYTQGELPAQDFILYRKQGSTAPTGASDEAFAEIPATSRSLKFSAPNDAIYSYGIAAVRRVGDDVYVGNIHAPAAWTGISQITLNFGGRMDAPPGGGVRVFGDTHIDTGAGGDIRFGTPSVETEDGRGITFGVSAWKNTVGGEHYQVDLAGAYLFNNLIDGTPTDVMIAAPLPAGTILTEVTVRMYRASTNDAALYEVYLVTSGGTVDGPYQKIHGGTGWGIFSLFFNQLISSAFTVVVHGSIQNEVNFQNRARLSWCELGYDRESLRDNY